MLRTRRCTKFAWPDLEEMGWTPMRHLIGIRVCEYRPGSDGAHGPPPTVHRTNPTPGAQSGQERPANERQHERRGHEYQHAHGCHRFLKPKRHIRLLDSKRQRSYSVLVRPVKNKKRTKAVPARPANLCRALACGPSSWKA